jgi:hypothetical protein
VIQLENNWKATRFANDFIAIRQALPFVENPRGLLIHRPRDAALRVWPSGKWASYIVVHNWCGASFTKKTTFVKDIPAGALLCKRCEIAAVRAGLPSAEEITGHHVCIGGVRAYNACHIHGDRQ